MLIWYPCERFQPTLPARGATRAHPLHVFGGRHFNPRSPHGERRDNAWSSRVFTNFNPRSPHGERPQSNPRACPSWTFQPTLPARGATSNLSMSAFASSISTHAPRTGSDSNLLYRRGFLPYFNPRSPHGERLYSWRMVGNVAYFNPRSPHGERRITAHCRLCRCTHFNPRSPHGERLVELNKSESIRGISTHAPRTGSDCGFDCFYLLLGISTHAPRTGSDVVVPAPLK